MKIWLVTFLLFLTSCANTMFDSQYKKLSENGTGCKANEISVRQTELFFYGPVEPWIATCKGKEFTCASINSGIVCSPR